MACKLHRNRDRKVLSRCALLWSRAWGSNSANTVGLHWAKCLDILIKSSNVHRIQNTKINRLYCIFESKGSECESCLAQKYWSQQIILLPLTGSTHEVFEKQPLDGYEDVQVEIVPPLSWRYTAPTAAFVDERRNPGERSQRTPDRGLTTSSLMMECAFDCAANTTVWMAWTTTSVSVDDGHLGSRAAVSSCPSGAFTWHVRHWADTTLSVCVRLSTWWFDRATSTRLSYCSNKRKPK